LKAVSIKRPLAYLNRIGSSHILIEALEKYSKMANIEQNISPHKLRHFLFTWLKHKGIDDALIQPYSGHETRQSLEIYSKLSLDKAQETYDENIKDFPV